MIGIELLAAAQGCDFHAPLASSAAAGGRARAGPRAGAAPRDDRHFHPDMEAAIALVRSGARGRPASAAGRLTHERLAGGPRGDAPLVVSFPHTGTSRRHRGAPRLALAGAQGRRLVDRAALRFRRRPRRDHRPHRDLAHGHRREPRSRRAPRSIPARPPPGSARPTTFDGEPLYAPAASRTRPRSTGAASRLFRPLSRGARRRDRPAARDARQRRALRLPFDPLGASRGCSTASCRSSTSAPTTARAATRRSTPRSKAACDATRLHAVVNGRFKGGWITRHYGRPARRRARDADGAGVPRLHARAGRPGRPNATGRRPTIEARAAPMRATLTDILKPPALRTSRKRGPT